MTKAEYARWYYHNKMSPEAKARKRQRQKEYQKNNPEVYSKYRENNKARVQAHGCTNNVAKGFPEVYGLSSLTLDSLQNWIEHQQGKLCPYCGQEANSVDHVVPLSRGGVHELSNLEYTCNDCNLVKRAKTREEFVKWIKAVYGYISAAEELSVKPPVKEELT